MIPYLRPFLSYLLFAAGLALIFERWLWYRELLSWEDAKMCGNCFLMVMCVPIELSLLAMIIAVIRLRLICVPDHLWYCWLCVVLGIALTPRVYGLPLFIYGFLRLTIFATRKADHRRPLLN
jgi:hypothetical protein